MAIGAAVLKWFAAIDWAAFPAAALKWAVAAASGSPWRAVANFFVGIATWWWASLLALPSNLFGKWGFTLPAGADKESYTLMTLLPGACSLLAREVLALLAAPP